MCRQNPILCVLIGIHAGPVIGESKFLYDLWGDVVNTPSRMESHGIANEIQATKAFAEKLGSSYQYEARGTVDVKGNGPMELFLVNRGPTAAMSA